MTPPAAKNSDRTGGRWSFIKFGAGGGSQENPPRMSAWSLSRRSVARRAAAVACMAAAVAALAVPSGEADSAATDLVQLVRVSTPTWEERDRLTNLGLDLTEHGGHDFVEVVLHGTEDVRVLRQAGFDWTVEIADLGARVARNRQLDAAYAARVTRSGVPSGRTTYRTLEDYDDELAALAKKYPKLVKPLQLPHPSVEGRAVNGIEIATNPKNVADGKPVFMIMGLHHAREWPSGEHTMEFAYDLLTGHGKDKRTTDLVNRTRTIVIPVVNPDGFNRSRTAAEAFDGREIDDEGDAYTAFTLASDAYKRRNCRVVDGAPAPPPTCAAPGARMTGVDLNRNYGALWGGPGASAFPVDDIYRGPDPFSEPETQNIRELVASRQVTMLVTNHTFSRLVLRPPGVRARGTTPDEPALNTLGAAMAKHNGYTNQPGWALYDTTGTTEDWSYTATGGFGYTFEIGDEFHPPYEEVVQEYLGTGKGERKGKNNRAAYFTALAAAADAQYHSVLTGKVSGARVLRLQKSFKTETSPVRPGEGWLVSEPTHSEGDVVALDDHLETVMRTGADGRFAWHVNPSTRPAVMERRLRVLDDEPVRSETHDNTQPTTVGDHIDVEFAVTEKDADMLQIDLEWATPDDYDLEVYRLEKGKEVEVASSGNIPGEVEQVLVEDPVPATYIARVVNFAAVNPAWTLTFGVYEAHDELLAKGTTERWTLTCEDTKGRVLAKRNVLVDRGQAVKVDLPGC
jgi:hypothetical protein